MRALPGRLNCKTQTYVGCKPDERRKQMTNHNARRGQTQENKNAVIKQNIIAELVSASSTQAVTPISGKLQALKTLKRVQGLSNFITGGFTLIELLVVVLIVAVLAAVALPQYNKAVAKARITQWITLADAFRKGVDAYILENGYPSEGMWDIHNYPSGTTGKITLPIDLPEVDFAYMAGAERDFYEILAEASIPHIDSLRLRNENNRWEGYCRAEAGVGVALCKMLGATYRCYDIDNEKPC